MNIGNEHAPKIDLIQELVTTYYLSKALNYQMKFVRDFVNADFRKRLSDAAAKNNYFCVGIESIIPNREMAAIEEIAMQVLEKVNEVDFNQKVQS
jgi:hypothetical protein